MNLYIESLSEYLISEWDRTLKTVDGPKEARFIVQSLDPEGALTLFQKLDSHRLIWLQQQTLTCYFRVATELWRDWCSTPEIETNLDQKMASFGALGPDGERLWIDEKDRLTWYRNRTTEDEAVDGLVIVLVGLNHATDQGGLADFHQVDEMRIWREMGESFVPWIKHINKRLDLHAGDTELEQFDTVLQQLFQVRPLRLGKLADFLEHHVIAGGDFYSLTNLTDYFFEQLPFWGIPPLFAGERPADLQGKKGADALKEADAFISHQRYKTPAGRKKDWQKIEKSLGDPEFELPATQDDDSVYKNVDDYRDTLRTFINGADAEARAKLLSTDFMPLLRCILQKVKPGKKASKTIPAITGMSFEVLLQGIWRALDEFAKDCGPQPLFECLAGIHVELVRFDHDLTADEDGGVGAEEFARELLQGCLGGLDSVFDSIDCRLPRDEDQARLPRGQWDREVLITLDLALDTLTYGTSRARPNVQFKVTVASIDIELTTEAVFKWVLGPTQPERVRFECARKVREYWAESPTPPKRLLPAFQISSVAMTALYFAADEDEANRLVTQAMTDFKLVNLLDGLSIDNVDSNLWEFISALITAYLAWFDVAIAGGYYTARASQLPQLLSVFIDLAEKVLDTQLLGSAELLRRFYKAFLLVDERMGVNDPYLPGAIAWGLSPAVLELTQARAHCH